MLLPWSSVTMIIAGGQTVSRNNVQEKEWWTYRERCSERALAARARPYLRRVDDAVGLRRLRHSV